MTDPYADTAALAGVPEGYIEGYNAGRRFPRSEAIFRGTMAELEEWLGAQSTIDVVTRSVVVYETTVTEPICTCEDEDTGRGFKDCSVHDPDPIVAGSVAGQNP